MLDRSPRVSIGMPVRNGERFIRHALDSLLKQSFGDFELIISDNASTDSTPDICHEYERADARVRYIRQTRNIGPAANHTRCFEHSRGEYFRWHAHDDLCMPEYLARCVDALDSSPDVVNCHTRTRVIDEHGAHVWDYTYRTTAASPNLCRRFGGLINASHRRHVGYEVFGLMRRTAIAETRSMGAYAHADRLLMVRMSLRGRFHEIPEFLFLARSHRAQSMSSDSGASDRPCLARWLGPGPLPPDEWWDASKRGQITFPDWRLLSEFCEAVNEYPMTTSQRVRCRLSIARWLATYWPKLGRDIAFATERSVLRLACAAQSAPAAPNSIIRERAPG